MANVVLYEEVPRLYKPPPQIVDPLILQRKSSTVQGLVREEVVEMFKVLCLVLEPLEMQMPYLRRHLNMDDLLRKLKWFAVLFEPITAMDIFDDEEKTIVQNFDREVDILLGKRGFEHEKDFQPSSGKMPVIPITDLLMGVYFDARPWTTLGRAPSYHAGCIS